MATIIELHGSATRGAAIRQDWAATALTSALIVALSIVVDTPTAGLAIAVLFAAGMATAALARRVLLPSEFAAVGALHAAAVLVLAL